MKKKLYSMRAFLAGFVLFMIYGTLVAQNYAFKCNFDVPSGQEVFPVTLTKATAAVSDGLLKVTLDGTSVNPQFTSKDLLTLAASTTTYKYLNIRMKNSTSGVNFKVLWLTSLKPGTYSQKIFNNSIAANDADFVNYSFDLTDANYTGDVKLFRIDCPINGPTTGFVEYDWIGLADEPLSTGIKSETTNPSLSIYPIPASNELNVSCESGLSKIQVLDLSGKLIKEVSGGSKSITLNIEDQSKGIYFIKVTDLNDKSIYSKFVKQ